MMSTFVATAAPRLSNLMEEGKAQKSIQEIDKLLTQAKNFYELTSKLEGRGRLPGQDKFNIQVGSYSDTTEAYNDLNILQHLTMIVSVKNGFQFSEIMMVLYFRTMNIYLN